MTAGEEWFNSYVAFLDRFDFSKTRKIGNYFLCPCCDFPTLSERACFEICQVCWWEDDGQDVESADVVSGGPNGSLSLSEARSNFQDHYHMFSKGAGIKVVEQPSAARQSLIAFVAAVLNGKCEFDETAFRKLESSL